MRKVLFLSFFLFAIPLWGHSQRVVNGQIADSESGKPLPFATIAYKGYPYGTISNENGEFQLQVPDWLKDTHIVISYMGYNSREYIAGSIEGELHIKLEKKVITLEEVQVKPLSPLDYLKLALRKIPINYSNVPFETKAYYREKFTENGDYVSLNEGVFKSYFTAQSDTNPNQHQLMLYRTADQLEDFQFMDRWIKKRQKNKGEKAQKQEEKYEKKKAKFDKKGKEFNDTLDLTEYDDWDFDLTEEIRKGFGGPEEILDMDLTRQTEDALDSTKFKKFRYTFGNPVTYQGMDLLTINFRTKKQLDHMHYMGRIYIDPSTDAIVGFDYRQEVVIPAIAKPILFAFGMVIDKPRAFAKIRYQKIGDFYFPQHFRGQVKIHMKKKYMWAKNDDSDFFMEMMFNIFDIKTDSPVPISKDKRYTADKKMIEQIHNEGNLNWSEINTLKQPKMTTKKVSW